MALRERAYDVAALAETGELRLSDDALVEMAARGGQVIVTFDNDIPRILALRRARAPSAVVLRLSNQTPNYVVPRLLDALGMHLEALHSGAIVVIEDAQTRVRRLPIRA